MTISQLLRRGYILSSKDAKALSRTFEVTTRRNNGTLSQQDKLLRLPLPDLKETIPKWLETTRPHLTGQEFERTKATAEAFITEAQPLQAFLEKKAKLRKNWFSDWWLDMAYLGYRAPLPVWSSPGIVMPPQEFGNSNEKWLSFATRFVEAALAYKDQVDAGLVPTDMSGTNPMDMVQYTRLFGATRIPGPEKDTQIVKSDSRYILIAHNGKFFTMQVKDPNGNNLSAAEIYQGLQFIVKESSRLTNPPIGLLTSDTRDNWCKAYQILKEKDAKNLALIEDSLFLLCLDDKLDSDDDILTSTALNSLHGLGTKANGANRWHDKALQFIIAKSGQVCICNEHSFAEAVPTMAISDFIKDRMKDEENYSLGTLDSQPPEPVIFNTSEKQLKSMLEVASNNLDELVNDLDMKALDFQTFGKEGIKGLKVSPDSFTQMAIQLTFHEMHGIPAATYESAATRIFAEGRTEVIRSCSTEAQTFVQTMSNRDSTLSAKREALLRAIKAHNTYARMAAQGLGVDRHLQGLKMAALELGAPTPELYRDPGYVRSSRMRLSTSQISSKHGSFCCYGPLETDGYGCSYSIGANNLRFSVSAMRSNGETNVRSFANNLAESLVDMYDVCTAKAKL